MIIIYTRKRKAVPIAPAPIITIFDILIFKKYFFNQKKADINSILPIIINIIRLNFEVVSKFEKFIFSVKKIPEVVVLVIVKIDNLNDFSNPILSTIKIPDNINKLTKKR